jgi:hypothetical protein
MRYLSPSDEHARSFLSFLSARHPFMSRVYRSAGVIHPFGFPAKSGPNAHPRGGASGANGTAPLRLAT